MKLRYLFSAVSASVLLFAGCQKEVPANFDNVQLSNTYLSIPENGGSVELTVTATEDWKFVIDENWPEVVTFGKDADGKTIKAKHDKFGNLINDAADIASKTPSWLTVSVMSGAAGETKVTFTADKVSGGRELELALTAGNNKQFLRVRQGTMESVSATCQEVIDGPDGKTYRVKGTCTSIANTTYGNWYLQDETGEVYIYGTLDAKGAEKNFASLKIEVGDVVEVEGPKTTYGTTIELVNVTVLSITKSLVKVTTEEQTLPKEGGEFEVKAAYKGNGIMPSVPEDYRSWISIADVKNKKGVATKIEPNPADTAVVTVYLAANEAGDRTGSIVFTSESGKSSSSVTYNFTQEGAIIETTADQINAAEDGATVYRYTGYLTKVENSKYGNIHVKDATGSVYCYGVLTDDGVAQKWSEMGINEGDIVTVVGPKASYNGAPQLKNVKIEKHWAVEDLTAADFLKKGDDKDVYFRLTGTVSNISSTLYGNFDLVDETGTVYVYGLTNGWGGASKQFASFGISEGDKITIVGYHTSYKDAPQVGGAFLVSKEEGGETPELPGGADKYETTVTYTAGDAFYDDGVAAINGVENVKVLKFGTSKKGGTCTVSVPAGAKKVVFYGVGWKGADCALTFSLGSSMELGKVTLKANDGATSNSPYTITVADSDYYELEIPGNFGSDMPVTVTSAARSIIWGVKIVK